MRSRDYSLRYFKNQVFFPHASQHAEPPQPPVRGLQRLSKFKLSTASSPRLTTTRRGGARTSLRGVGAPDLIVGLTLGDPALARALELAAGALRKTRRAAGVPARARERGPRVGSDSE